MTKDKERGRTIVWVSAGAASAVAAKLILAETRENVELCYCETGAEHPDNARFLADLTRWLNMPVKHLRSEKYDSTWQLWEKRRFLSGVHGAICTGELKVIPRLNYQLPSDIHVFGYTNDKADRKRANQLRETYPLLKIKTPLIDAGLNKANCLALIEAAQIKLPLMYAMGFQNNNCIPCVKATSPDYWSLVRREFPAEFGRMAKLARELNVRLTRIKDERLFIDEIPADWPCTDPIQPACDFLCSFAEMEMQHDD